eukprot:10551272-Alexandrium_andersonii.AAC.1
MSASLVGSEMCIRDRSKALSLSLHGFLEGVAASEAVEGPPVACPQLLHLPITPSPGTAQTATVLGMLRLCMGHACTRSKQSSTHACPRTHTHTHTHART